MKRWLMTVAATAVLLLLANVSLIAQGRGGGAKPQSPAPKQPVSTMKTADPGPSTLSPIQQKLQSNAHLTATLQSRLPAGTDLMGASAGFRNLGQFVAAVNVSNNLNIPFADLKAKMVGEGLSLGQSIQTLKPTVSGTIEAHRADYDARGTIIESEQAEAAATATGATSSKKKPKTPAGGGSDE